jgi:hypothetical protein
MTSFLQMPVWINDRPLREQQTGEEAHLSCCPPLRSWFHVLLTASEKRHSGLQHHYVITLLISLTTFVLLHGIHVASNLAFRNSCLVLPGDLEEERAGVSRVEIN